jgi:hypothetical protein
LTKDGVDKLCEWIKGAGDPRYRLTVNGATKLDRFLQDVKKRVGRNKINVLSILCHGLGYEEYRDEAKTKIKVIHGGFGMEFCDENILPTTVRNFRALRGLFANRNLGIKLIGCAAAAEEQFNVVPSGKEKKRSFGRRLCWSLARATGTGIMASSSLQDVDVNKLYRKVRSGWEIKDVEVGKCVEPGKWEGKVWILTPDRKIKAYRQS